MVDKKIVILDGQSANPGDLSWEQLENFGELTVYDDTPYEDKEIINRIGDAEIVLTNKVPINRNVMEQAPNLKFVNVLATGINNIDEEVAGELGVTISNVPAYSTESVTQHTIALLLEITSQVGSYNQAVSDGLWSDSKNWTYYDKPLLELSGKTIGIIGFGAIGRSVGTIAKTLGMNVIAYNRSQTEEGRQIAEYVSLEDLYKQADVISLHIPLTDDTEKMIDDKAFELMKDNVILINSARGPLIDEEALVKAYNDGKLYAAGLDVTTNEPIEADNPMLDLERVFITPHIAWATKDSRSRLINTAVNNVGQYIQGNPQNTVNS